MTRLLLFTFSLSLISALPSYGAGLDDYVPPPMFDDDHGIISNFDDEPSLVRIYQESEPAAQVEHLPIKVIKVPPPSIVHLQEPKVKPKPKAIARRAKVQKSTYKIDGGYLVEPSIQDILNQIHPQ